MKLPRDLSGRALVIQLTNYWGYTGYTKVHQRGSHIVLETQTPCHHRIAIRDHQSLRIGTLSAILKAVADHKGVSREEILKRQ